MNHCGQLLGIAGLIIDILNQGPLECDLASRGDDIPGQSSEQIHKRVFFIQGNQLGAERVVCRMEGDAQSHLPRLMGEPLDSRYVS